jgi:hypothetical protein
VSKQRRLVDVQRDGALASGDLVARVIQIRWGRCNLRRPYSATRRQADWQFTPENARAQLLLDGCPELLSRRQKNTTDSLTRTTRREQA